MVALVAGDRMAKRDDTPVKMDSEVVRKAKIVAAFRGQSLAEFLSETLGEIVDSLIDEAYAKEKGEKSPKTPKSKRGKVEE